MSKPTKEELRSRRNGVEEPTWLTPDDDRILASVWDDIIAETEEEEPSEGEQRVEDIGQLPDSPERYGRLS